MVDRGAGKERKKERNKKNYHSENIFSSPCEGSSSYFPRLPANAWLVQPDLDPACALIYCNSDFKLQLMGR
jgi:hypothetical protein